MVKLCVLFFCCCFIPGNNSRSAVCVQLGYGWNRCPFSKGFGIRRNVPSHVHWSRLSAPSTRFQCVRWKKAYAMASESPRLRICSGGRIRDFCSSKYLGTCGLNSTARCIASTALISAALRPRLLATSGEKRSLTARAFNKAAV